ncbi:crosslink repair DNA glycosylase YcaQ family protein [Streptomyces olivoreticuli]
MGPIVTLPAAVERAAVAAHHGWGTSPGPDSIGGLADAQAGLHAARLLTPYVTAHTRLTAAFTPGHLRQALAPGGALVKVRCMRRTLHLWPLVQAADAHTATMRLRLGAARATARRHDLDQADLQRWADRTVTALSAGPLTYRDLQAHLAKRHNDGSTEAVRLGIKWAWESGDIACRNVAASLHREERQFALLDHAHPGLDLASADPRTATVALVRRYLRAYGPAAEGDLLWWSGLTRSEITPALAALRPEITRVHVQGLPGELLTLDEDLDRIRSAVPLPPDHVRLLAFEDPTFKGYFTTRTRYHDPAHTTRAFNPIGEVRATITVAGRINGTWEWDKRSRTVRFGLFTRLPRLVMREVRRQLAEAEAFLRTEPC